MTRRDAVKLGGAALAGVGLSAGASGASADSGSAPSRDWPDFRGKVVSFYIRAKKEHLLLGDPVFAMQGGRLFVTGISPALGNWADGLSVGFAWDLVESYCVYESLEDYRSRMDGYKSAHEAKAEQGSAGSTQS
jgi:hypothetical protein